MSRGNRVDVYLDADKRWRWRFISSGRTMADSGQGYHNRIDCISGAAVVTSAFHDGVMVRILPRHPSDPLDPTREDGKTDAAYEVWTGKDHDDGALTLGMTAADIPEVDQ